MNWMRTGEFPKPVSICIDSIGWNEIEIQQWIVDCATASREIAELGWLGRLLPKHLFVQAAHNRIHQATHKEYTPIH